jgi:saccharopine dehydrogenase (NAD+, L-lysine-forming)
MSNQHTIGLIREGRIPPDKRVPFTPAQCQEILQRFQDVRIICETSDVRAYSDNEFEAAGIPVSKDLSGCDILMGIKEVPVGQLINGKTYLFFSHTIKKQPYNRALLISILEKKIRLIDYEALKDSQGNRLVAFGRFAGIVGAYNGLLTYGMKHDLFKIRRAYECFDINDLKLEIRKIQLPPIKIILTGSGRVSRGAMETLDTAGIRKVNPEDFLNSTFTEPVYVQLSSRDYHRHQHNQPFSRAEFFQHPERYQSFFTDFLKVTDLLLAGAYWHPKAPVLFTREDMQQFWFKTDTIADITCDIRGSIPSTIRATSIQEPLYDYDPVSDSEHPAFSDKRLVTVMSIDNLPCELPRSASEEFGRDLIDRILNPLLGTDKDGIIARATITENGQLGKNFKYLEDYVSGK